MTLCEAQTGGAFDGVNCQHRGAFDIYLVKVKCPGKEGGGGERGLGALGIDWYIKDPRFFSLIYGLSAKRAGHKSTGNN